MECYLSKKVLLCGAGQIGFRHIQSLISTDKELKISVFDADMSALISFRDRISFDIHHKNIELEICGQLDCAIQNPDLAIIATPASGRYQLIEKLTELVSPNYWLVEKVLAQSSAELDSIQKIMSGQQAWVNHPRRLQPLHRKIKQLLNEQDYPLRLKVSGGGWGLACNAVHFIDLIRWWTDATVVSVDVTRLDQGWFEAKRPGFFEPFGSVKLAFSDGSQLELECDQSGQPIKLSVGYLDGPGFEIDEQTGRAKTGTGLEIEERILMQSELTGPWATSVFEGVDCSLPSINHAYDTHALFIGALQENWNSFVGTKESRVPIT